MLILLTVSFLILTIVCICNASDEAACCSGFIFLVFLIISIILGISVTNGRTLDAKIAMYTEENTNIEESMNVLVQQYMNYESGTYGELKNESSITLVSLYPDLKADTLVEKQIEVYLNNNREIRKLKEKQIELSVKKWWLYFGK